MHKQRIAMLVAAGVGALACFLPWLNAPFIGSVVGTQGSDGWIVLGLYALSAVLVAALPKRTEPLAVAPGLGPATPGLAASAVGVWKIVDLQLSLSKDAPNAFAKALADAVSVGIGLYLVVLAGFVSLGLSFAVRRSTASATVATAAAATSSIE